MEDRSWMYRRYVAGVRGITIEFERGAKAFIAFAVSNSISGKIRCPCVKCKNMRFESPDMVLVHLYKKGFVANYYEWTSHGEKFLLNTQPKEQASSSSTSIESPAIPKDKQLFVDACGDSKKGRVFDLGLESVKKRSRLNESKSSTSEIVDLQNRIIELEKKCKKMDEVYLHRIIELEKKCKKMDEVYLQICSYLQKVVQHLGLSGPPIPSIVVDVDDEGNNLIALDEHSSPNTHDDHDPSPTPPGSSAALLPLT